MPSSKSALLRLRLVGVKITDGVKHLDISHRIRTRRASDGRLIHQHYLIQILCALQPLQFRNKSIGGEHVLLPLGLREGAVENIMYES